MSEAFLSDSPSVVAFFRPDQTAEERVAVDNLDTEFVEDSDAVGLRCWFDQSGGDELEECFIIDDVETQPGVHAADHVDERPGSAVPHDC